MPRRRKKSHCNRPPLIFTESPVNNQWNVPSPVLCAEHPPTAKALPIQDCTNLPWVSPQFSVQRTVRGQRCARRRRHNSLTSNAGKKRCNNVTYSSVTGNKIKSKFKPLKFIEDRSLSPTMVDNIDITDDDDDITDKERIVMDKNQNSSDDGSETENVCCFHTPQHKNKLDISNGQGLLQQADVERDLDYDLSHVNPNRVDTPDLDDTISLMKKVKHSPNFLRSPVKILFTKQSEGCDERDCDQDKVNEGVRRSNRLRERLLHNLEISYWKTDNTNSANDCIQVLVPDTPEAEYGLSNRARRLHKKHKRK